MYLTDDIGPSILSIHLSTQLSRRRQVWQRCSRKPRAVIADHKLCSGNALVLLHLQENTSYGTSEATAEIPKENEESREKKERNKKQQAREALFKAQVQTGTLGHCSEVL